MIGSSANTLRDKEPRGMMVCLRQKEKDKHKSELQARHENSFQEI